MIENMYRIEMCLTRLSLLIVWKSPLRNKTAPIKDVKINNKR